MAGLGGFTPSPTNQSVGYDKIRIIMRKSFTMNVKPLHGLIVDRLRFIFFKSVIGVSNVVNMEKEPKLERYFANYFRTSPYVCSCHSITCVVR